MAGYIGSKASVVSSGVENKKVITATAGQTSFTGLTYSPNRVHVFQNGVRLVDGTDYTATDGNSLTLTVGALADDQVVVVSYSGFQTSDTVSSSAGGTFTGDVNFTGAFTSQGIDDNANATAITIDSSENVGIGTSLPSSILHVSSSDPEFILTDTSTNVDHSLDGNSGTGVLRLHVDKNSEGSDPSYIINMAGSEAMRIDSNGVLKINGSSAWNETNQGTGKGSIHLDPNSGTDHTGGAITFGASDSSSGETAMAGIYTRSDSSYGTKMYLATTDSYANGPKTAVKIDHSGQVTTPRQCSFAVAKSNSHVSAGTVVVYNSVLNNTGGNYSTSNGRFTAPVQGKYFIATNHMSDNDTTYDNKYYTIRVNGTDHQRVYSSSGGAVHHRFSWAGVIALNTGDFIDVFTNNVKLYGLNTTYAHFSGHLLG